MTQLIPVKLRIYGQFKFLTFQCLLLQVLNAALHVLAYFVRALEKPRDLVFSALAYPVGSLVVYTFWAVWHTLGREFIFPLELSQYYPDWLNHATHTIIVPINILLAVLVHHKYSSAGLYVTLAFTGFYTLFLHLIKAQSGLFVYKYLDAMGDVQRLVYFGLTGVFAHITYKSGQLLTELVHGRQAAGGVKAKAPAAAKKQKQK